MTTKCIELVKKFEGFSPVPYLCPAGYPTVGYGHVVTEPYVLGQYPRLTEEEAEAILFSDLVRVEVAIKPLIRVPVHEWMLDALVSFSFNVGIGAFRASTLRRLLNQAEYYEAADQFLRWVYAGGKKLRGLVLRRQAERQLFLEGVHAL